MKFTILGSNGFIGKNLLESLKKKEIETYCPDIRKDDVSGDNLGNIIFVIGVTDFLIRPFDAVDAHVCYLKKILTDSTFDSLLYCSGTRVYQNGTNTDEKTSLSVNPNNLDHLYNISKIMGESLCFASKNPKIKIVRLSNVTGNNFNSNLFIPSIIRDAVKTKKIILKSTLNSTKDYIHVNDVTNILQKICIDGKNQIYNVASGQNISSQEIIEKINQVEPIDVEVLPNSPENSFPPIDIKLLKNEFNFKPMNILDHIPDMVHEFKNFFKNN